jgi:hypothetical protein
MSESLNRKRQIQEYKTQQPVIDKSAAIHTCTPPQDEYMTLKEKVNLAMAWYDSGLEDRAAFQTLMESILAQPPQRTEQEPVAHSVIAGALFDFMGWLTSRKERIVLSSADNASPAVEAITEFAKMRNLSLDDAKVQDWRTHPPQRTWVGLTDEEVESYWDWEDFQTGAGRSTILEMVRDIEAKLKQKNI